MDERTDKNLIPVDISNELKSSYIDYSMSVIVSRALPDVRDGLKPVHRRVLYGMYTLGTSSSRPHKKSATIVGEVLGKYHPHGDTSIYDTMVRMAQPWALRYLMVDGHGNFGSVDGDSPAAMRYTEARMQKMAEQMLFDIDKDTVDFQPNFDETQKEPIVLPSRVPNLLVNGASGIAVGMATNIPPHNLSAVIDATIACVEDPLVSSEALIDIVKAPDFPTGGIIYGYEGVKEAYLTGRGKILIRARHTIEDINGRSAIVVTEIPYQVNKADMIKKTADLINDHKLDGISTIRDESDRQGMRIVYVLKRDAVVDVVVNSLFKHTNLQASFNVNNVALVDGRPQLLTLRESVLSFVNHRFEILIRKTKFQLSQAQARLHILEGLLVAIDHLDEVIATIRKSRDKDEAKSSLMSTYALSELQTDAILALRLQQLTALERDAVKQEHAELVERISYLNRILSEESLRKDILKADMLEVREKFGDARRTEVNYSGGDFSIEDTIPNEDVVVTLSEAGYIKRTPITEYKVQHRGGVGKKGSLIRSEDFIRATYACRNHQYILLFTQKGHCFWMRVFEIPEGSRAASKGRAIQNLIQIEEGDKICSMVLIDKITDQDFIDNHYLTIVTRKGIIKKTQLSAYSKPRVRGVKAIQVKEQDALLEAILTDGSGDIMIATKMGKAIRFEENLFRPIGRSTSGVKGITLSGASDEVVGVIHISRQAVEADTGDILVVSEFGFGKRTKVSEYRSTGRGGKGVITMNTTDKVGKLVAMKVVKSEDELVVFNKSGLSIRLGVSSMRLTGRNTQGVRIVKVRSGDKIAAVTSVDAKLLQQSTLDSKDFESDL